MSLHLLLCARWLCRWLALIMLSPDRLSANSLLLGGGLSTGDAMTGVSRSPSPGIPFGSGTTAETRMALERILPVLRLAVRNLGGTGEEIRSGIQEVGRLVAEAWAMRKVGREVAQALCDAIRLEGALDQMLNLLRSPEPHIKYETAELVEQILVADNRDRVARIGLGMILNLAKEQDDVKLATSVSGILEHMFKHTEETCHQLICNGGLDSILYWCRWTDHTILCHCARALANCAMYGGHDNQRLMIEKKAAEWLFPLAFSKDDELIRFHACLAITVLATNKEIEKQVEKSGTLALVEPFIASLDPEEFTQKFLQSSDNVQGQNTDDLQRLIQLLDSSRLETQCIAAFYLCVEAGIKAKQRNMGVLHRIGATHSLKRIVSYSSNCTTSSLAKKALRIMGEEVPRRISPNVPNWKAGELQIWLQQIGFSGYCEVFEEQQVDGDLLLKLTEAELKEELQMKSSLTRKRFLRELTELKAYASYATCDPSNLADWLGSIDPRFRQYTYPLVNCGISRSNLPNVTEQHLNDDCGIETGFHRVQILNAAKDLLQPALPCDTSEPSQEGPDVFISYRRLTGSQLASLLKVHLQLHGYTVFIDVEKLEAGKFEDKLIQSVKSARNFVLVLSENALTNCMGDEEMKDWVHKEIALALSTGKNIVPVADKFQWPDPCSLPEDMRAVLKFNGIKWSHEYQEATIEKIIRFLKGRPSRDQSALAEGTAD
ncbi:NAD(+) hydrolase SARM1 [Protopterus annectens]|uniref:NAD(+) hydrolase SARM1 n=1 Tax=Protopterus annectens TaxID=7888 RepID=UPI001CFB9374|nr:NAD(+) hydrolase SARM1 [Protopterus annectens]